MPQTLDDLLRTMFAVAPKTPGDFTSGAHGWRGYALRRGRGAQLSDRWWRRHPGAKLVPRQTK